MNNAFEKIMSAKSDSELIEVLKTERHSYRQEAIDAAEAEFRKRNIPEETTLQVQKVAAEKQVVNFAKAEEELDLHWKLFAFLFPWWLLFIFSKKYEVEGYTRKGKELAKFTVYGFCFYIGLVILISFLR